MLWLNGKEANGTHPEQSPMTRHFSVTCSLERPPHALPESVNGSAPGDLYVGRSFTAARLRWGMMQRAPWGKEGYVGAKFHLTTLP